MATLYWRVKRPNGKWTFVSASAQLRQTVKDLGYAPAAHDWDVFEDVEN